MFKKYLVGLFLLLGLVGVVLRSQAIENRGAFTINNFVVDILVKKNAILEVEEIIDVNFSEKRHGIFREIPVKYKDEKGFAYNMRLNVLAVEDEKGRSIEYQISTSNNNKVLKIGDPDLEVIGDQKYAIRYEIEKGMRYFADHDEIYWNPIGTSWPTTIKNASSTIRFEDGVDFISGSGICFAGIFGSEDKNCLVKESASGEVFFSADKILSSYEGLTVAVSLPKGAVMEPTKWQYFLLFLTDNWGFGMPVVIFFGMFIFWKRRGKEIDLKKTIIAQYEAPDNLTPGEVGFLMKERYSVKFVTADIINLAVKGYLDIREIEKVDNIIGKVVSRFFGFGFLVIFVGVFLAFFKSQYSSNGIGFLFIAPLVFIFVWRIIKFSKKKVTDFDYELENRKEWISDEKLTKHERELLEGLFGEKKLGKIKLSSKKNSFYKNIQSAGEKIKDKFNTDEFFETSLVNKKGLYVVIGIIGFFGVIFIGSSLDRVDLVFGSILSLPIIILFGVLMSKKTRKGAEIYWQVKGYKHYIDIAEKHRSEFNAKENIFEKNLPYAMVFGNIDKWAKAFEGISKEQPDWYHSNSMNSFSPTLFASTINSGFASATQAASVSPSSSSSGGSSGGGGGGGGGGSW